MNITENPTVRQTQLRVRNQIPGSSKRIVLPKSRNYTMINPTTTNVRELYFEHNGLSRIAGDPTFGNLQHLSL